MYAKGRGRQCVHDQCCTVSSASPLSIRSRRSLGSSPPSDTPHGTAIADPRYQDSTAPMEVSRLLRHVGSMSMALHCKRFGPHDVKDCRSVLATE